MDQTRIGAFIAKCRKEENLTQAQLGKMVGISDRAVSKWETGRSMPDISIIPDVCNILKITINELLNGERISMDAYKEKAESQLIALKELEEHSNKKMLHLEVVIGYTSTIAFLSLIFAGSYGTFPTFIRAIIIGIGIILFITGLYHALRIEQGVGYYTCKSCGYQYIPSISAVVLAKHIGRSRKMKCPHCKTKNYHKKILVKD